MSALSCFIEGTSFQFAWDSVSLGWFKDCPRKYQLSMGLDHDIVYGPLTIPEAGWATKAESIHLRWGQLYHSALELYDHCKLGNVSMNEVPFTHDEALAYVVRWLLQETWDGDRPWVPDHKAKTREALVRTVIWYLEQFRNDPAHTLILADGRPAVELSFRLPLGDLSYGNHQVLLCGHLDRVVEFQDGLYVMDHKTTSTTISSNYFDQYDLDGQMSGYTLAGKIVLNAAIRGVIIDAAQVAVGFSRFARGLTYRTEAQLEEWIDNTQWWIGQAYTMALEGYWPMNDRSCNKYGGCPFRGVCNKDPSVRHRFLDSNYVRHRWNPLEVR